MEISIEYDEQLSQEIQQVKEQIDQFVSKTTGYHISDQLIDRLLRLKEDLPERPEIWLHANVFAVLNPDTFVQTARNSFRKTRRFWWLDAFDVARNLLILCPIMLTWLALSRASDAYAQAVAADPDLFYTPFLALWQSDFNGLLQPFLGFLSLRLSDVAWFDFILILLIIGLSAIVHMARDSYMEKQEKAVMSLAEDLNSLLWQLDRIFIRFRQYRYENSEQRAMEMMINIDRYVRAIRQQVMEQFKSIAQEEKQLMERAQETQVKFQENQSAFLKTIHGEHQNSLKTTSRHINDMLAKQQAAFGEWVSRLQSALTDITAQAQAIERKQSELAETLALQQKDLLNSANAHFIQLDQQQQKMLEQIASSQASLVQQGDQLKLASTDMRETASSFRKGVDDMGQFIPNLNKSLNSFGQSVTLLAKDAGDISNAQNRMIDALQSLEGMIAVFENITARLVVDLRSSSEKLVSASALNGEKLEAINATVIRFTETGQSFHTSTHELQEAVHQNNQGLLVLQEQVRNSIDQLNTMVQLTQTMIPFMEQLTPIKASVTGMMGNLSEQAAVLREHTHEIRSEYEAQRKLAELVAAVESGITSVSTNLRTIEPLLIEFVTISNRLYESSNLVAERLAEQNNPQTRFAQFENHFDEGHNGNSGNDHASSFGDDATYEHNA